MKSQVEVEQGDKGSRIADEKIRQRPVTSRASLLWSSRKKVALMSAWAPNKNYFALKSELSRRFSYFSKNAAWAGNTLDKVAKAQLGLALLVGLSGASIVLPLWLFTAGLLNIPLAALLRWSGNAVGRSRQRTATRFRQTCRSFKRLPLRPRMRTYRSAPRRSASDKNDDSGDAGGSGSEAGSDSDSPGAPSIRSHHTAFPNPSPCDLSIWKKLLRPWRCLGCCCMEGIGYGTRGWGA